MNETNAESDEALSAQAAIEFTKDLNKGRLYPTSVNERRVIEYAILENGRPRSFSETNLSLSNGPNRKKYLQHYSLQIKWNKMESG